MKWISVKDQLPAESEIVLVFAGNSRFGKYFIDYIAIFDDENGLPIWFDPPSTGITHWMPLPEPPKD